MSARAARPRAVAVLIAATVAAGHLGACVTSTRVIEEPLTSRADGAPSPDSDIVARDEGDPEWERWQRPEELLDWIALGADDHVVELGAATGRFSERILARLGPGGTLTVVDNDPRFVSSLEKFAARDPRVRAVALDPNLESAPPMQADVVIIRNFAHRVERRDLLYPLARASLRPGGRLVVVDFRAARTNPGPPLPDRIPEPYARAAWAREGFRPVDPALRLPCQYAILFAWDGPTRRGPLAPRAMK
ncbi:MAG: class I SAM-dependent methyltransferase [Myxococcales bacterium]|nr:class I SAM-dependent methyltransferase [Myxococcales bacterium]